MGGAGFINAISGSPLISDIALQSDGKIIVGGYFSHYNGTSVQPVVRLNTNGTLDGTFAPAAITYNGSISNVNTVAIQPTDGKIIVGGGFTSVNGNSRNRIVRLNTDGSEDVSFATNIGVAASDNVFTISIQADGKILVGGYFSNFNSNTAAAGLVRLNSTGSLDMGFNLNTAGATGITGGYSQVYAFAIQTDGKIIVAGNFTNYNGYPVNSITRVSGSDGTRDVSFNILTGVNSSVTAIVIQPDKKIVIGGSFTAYNGTALNRIARLNSDGSVDATFNIGTGANAAVNAIALQSDGKIIIGGSFASYNGTNIKGVARLNSDGSLDNTFNAASTAAIVRGANNSISAIAIQSDGKILIGGAFTSYIYNNGTTTTTINRIARLNSDGSLDPTFNPKSGSTASGAGNQVNAIAIQSDGKIIVGGSFTNYIYGGTTTSNINRITRLNTDGSLDASFNIGTGTNAGTSSTPYAIAIQSDGKIIIAGGFISYKGTSSNGIVRLNNDASIDPSFNVGTGANGAVYAIAIQGSGKIIIGGMFTTYNATSMNRIAVLNSDGSLDATATITSGLNNTLSSMALQNDGKILVGGNFSTFNGIVKNRIARLSLTPASPADLSALTISNGTLSPSFTTNTTNYTASVANSVSSITITPTVSDANATIQVRVNGGSYATVASGSASLALSLNVGSNTIDVLVTAQNGTTTKTYTTTVTRAASSDATLSAISISAGTLSPVFAASTTGYTATTSASNITVTPTVNQTNATVKVNGTAVTSGNASGAINLNLGTNTISIVVTAQDGTTTKTYTIVVTRAADPIIITGFTPSNGVVGSTVTITGTGFNATMANNIVFFGATKATVTAVTATSLTVTVPSGATYGPISVLNASTTLVSYSGKFFTPTFSPSKSGITAADMVSNVEFTTGTGPRFLAVGDIDGDGKPDLAFVNYKDNTVSVLRNAGSIGTLGFASKVDFASGASPISLALGDLDGDGRLDMAVVNSSDNTVSIYRNTSSNGTISFANKIDVITGTDPLAIAISDIDGDGKPDLAVANSSANTVSIFQNTSSNGSIGFSTKVDFATGNFPTSIAIGDMDGDNKPDMAVLNSLDQSFSILRNTSSGGTLSLAAKVDFSVNGLTNLALGDIDGDGKLDVALALGYNWVSVLRNTGSIGTISLAAKVDFPISNSNPGGIAIGDLDGDGKPDLAIANSNNIQSENVISILRNIGSGSGMVSFATKVDFNTPYMPGSTIISDLDGDGKPDIAAVTGNNSVAILRNAATLSNNANLLTLISTAGTLSPTFDSATANYTTTVANSVSSITVTPTTADANATVKVNGTAVTNGNASGAISLNVGSNTISVVVTAQDGTTTKTYTLTINRLDVPGNALNFNGSNYLQANNTTVGNFGTGDFTTEAWINIPVTSIAGQVIIGKRIANSLGNFWLFSLYNNKLSVEIAGGTDIANYTTIQSTSTVNDGNWHHVALVKSGTQLYLYIDGQSAAAPVTLNGTPDVNNSGSLRIGNWTDGNSQFAYLTGTIDEVRLWNTARTQAQIQSSMYTQFGSTQSGLVLYYTFNQGIAGGNNTGLTNVIDGFGNGNNGTLNNFALNGTTSNWVQGFVPALSADATLSSLSISNGTLTPTFASATTNYTAIVSNATTSVTITPTRSEANATIQVRVNGGSYATVASGSASSALGLNVGSNTVDVLVTAQDGTTTKTYTITVTKLAALDKVNLTSTTQTPGAYSLRKLSTSYTGNAIKVRRSSDNALQDIGFTTNGDLDTAALKNFVGSDNGFVTIWYDQSGAGNNAVQATTNLQPAIATAGTVLRMNGRPALSFNSSKLVTGSVSGISSQPYALSVVHKFATATGGQMLLFSSNATLETNPQTNSSYTMYAGASANVGSLDVNTNILSAIYNTTSSSFYKNGSLTNSSFNTGTSVPDYFSIGQRDDAVNAPLTGFMAEFICVGGNFAERANLETNQTNYYRSVNADLSTLTTTTGTLSPTFATATTSYTATVNNATTSITVTPTSSDVNATIQVQVNGGGYATVASGSASSAFSLNVGSNTINVQVTAQDGTTTKTYTITVLRAAIPPGNSLNLDGGNNYVSVSNSSSLNFGASTDFTVEAWIRLNGNNNSSFNGFIAKGGAAYPWTGYQMAVYQNKLVGEIMDGTTLVGTAAGLQGTTSLNDNRWHHVAMVVSRSTTNVKLYVDGNQEASVTNAAIANNITNTSSLFIGTERTSGIFFNGTIDEVRIWNTARTASQLQMNMLNVVGSSTSGLVAYYNFDNGTAGGNNTGLTTLFDQTSNANNGTLNNFALAGASSNWVESYAMVVPTTTSATTIGSTSFTANWTAPAVGTVTNYLLDVSASSSFASFVSGYDGLSVTGTSQAVTGLSPLTPYYYRVRADKTSVTDQGGNSAIISVTTSSTNTWTGTTSTDWNTPGNWSTGTIPTSTDNVVIATASNQPTVSTTQSVNNVTINSGTTLTVTGTLNIGGTIANSGTFTATAGTIAFNGTNPQTIAANTFSGNTINNLIINNAAGVTLGGTLGITGVFTPTAGTFTTGGNLIIKSSASATGAIVSGSGIVSGNVTVERYIPSYNRKKYVLVGSPVNSPTIYSAWQEGGQSVSGYGTQITGSTASNGFDAISASGLPSIFTYNDNNAIGSKWTGLTNTNTNTLGTGKGYLLYVRGDRTITPSTSGSNNTVLRATGTIAQGSVSPTLSNTSANKFNLIANPYACPIDWTTGITKTNILDAFWVYDPNTGMFVTYSGGTAAPANANVTNYLQSGQAFFVYNTAASPSITFSEASKTTAPSTGSANTVFGSQSKVQLLVNVLRTDGSLADGVVALFKDGYTKGISQEDAPKLSNLNETFSLINSGNMLSIEGRPSVTGNDTLNFAMGNFSKKAYTLELSASNFTTESAVLIDHYTGTRQPLDMQGTTSYGFIVNSEEASSAMGRFQVVLGAAATNASADASATGIRLSVYPNPSNDHVTVSFVLGEAKDTEIKLLNALGQTVQSQTAGKVQQGEVKIAMKQCAAGLYTVQIISGGKVIATKQLMKE